MAKWNELSAEQLKYNCNISSFDFETTENLEPITDVVGQERAVKAVQFGLFNKSNGYNIYIGMGGLVPVTAIMVWNNKNNFMIDLDEYFTISQIETIFENHYNKNVLTKVV